MAKKIQNYVKLQIKAGQANPSPPIGPALGQNGVNIMEFCKMFNSQTQNFEKGTPLSVIITVYSDKSFIFVIKTPPVSFLLKKALNIESGSSKPSKEGIGILTYEQIEEIAKIKQPDLTASTINAAVKTIIGSARSLGLKIEEARLLKND